MAAQFIINLDSISVEQAKDDILEYLATKPDYTTWKDYYESSQGQTVIELLAGLQASLASKIIMGRRESYLGYAQTRSANVGIAGTLGYSSFRGKNARISINITPTETTTIAKFTVVGSVLDTNLVLIEDAVLSAGVPTTIYCTIGEVKEATTIAPDNSLRIFRFYNADVSDDMRLYIDDVEVTYSTAFSDLIKDKYITITNAFGAVDVSYLNTASPQYGTGSEIKIEYVELKSLDFSASDVSLDYDGVTSTVISDVYTEPEDIESIKINAPIYHETQNTIRGREDYPKLVKALNTDFIDTTGFDFSPAVVHVSYVKSDLTLLSSTEKQEILDALLSYRPFGVQPATLVEPIRSNLTVNVTCKLLTTTTDNISEFVTNILAENEKMLGQTLDMDYIENQIEQASYIKTARVSVNAPTWLASTLHGRRDFVSPSTPNNFIYQLKNNIRLSGSTEPTWPEVEGSIITDGDLTWKCIVDDRCSLLAWEADTNYNEYDIIAPTGQDFKYVVIERTNLSGAIEPTWTTAVGDIIEDNQVIFQCITEQGTPSTWAASTSYKIGDIVVPTVANGQAYTVVGYKSQTDAVEPTWPTTAGDTVVDGDVEWEAVADDTTSVESVWNEYLIISNNLTITSS
jgi:hypothetical protein